MKLLLLAILLTAQATQCLTYRYRIRKSEKSQKKVTEKSQMKVTEKSLKKVTAKSSAKTESKKAKDFDRKSTILKKAGRCWV